MDAGQALLTGALIGLVGKAKKENFPVFAELEGKRDDDGNWLPEFVVGIAHMDGTSSRFVVSVEPEIEADA